MNIQLIPRRFELTDSLCDFAVEKLSHLDLIGHAIVAANVVLSKETRSEPSRRFMAKVRLLVRGRDLHAMESSSDIYSALDLVQGKLARQLRKRKTRLRDCSTQRLQRRAERAKRSGLAF